MEARRETCERLGRNLGDWKALGETPQGWEVGEVWARSDQQESLVRAAPDPAHQRILYSTGSNITNVNEIFVKSCPELDIKSSDHFQTHKTQLGLISARESWIEGERKVVEKIAAQVPGSLY